MDQDQRGKILFVDDDASLRTVVPIALMRDGHEVATAANGEEALAKFAGGRFDLVIQDVRMPGMDGLTLLAHLKERSPDVPVVVMTAFSTWDVAVEAMRLGAFDYLKKPFDNDDLRQLARRAVGFGKQSGPDDAPGRTRMIGSSPGVKAIQDIIRRVARNDSTVLVEGESGTGKELVAAMIHSQSHRKEGPFIAVNCGGFSETLLESELFGHVKGAFTGAVADKRGLLELADGGTFFLDEIGETTLSTQVRLLRVLETKTFTPVGGEKPRKTDVRFVAATNRDMLAMSKAGTFRQDLYYRLNVIPVRVPPLRERKDDIPMLAGYFLSLYAERFGKELAGFESGAMDALLAYDWPGNVRELQNAIQRAVSLVEKGRVGFSDIFPSWTPRADSGHFYIAPAGRAASLTPEPAAAVEMAAGADAGGRRPDLPVLTPEGFDLEKVMSDIEADYIRQALAMTGNNMTHAADLLGLTFRSMRYKVKKTKPD